MHKTELLTVPVFPGSNILMLLVAPKYFPHSSNSFIKNMHCYRPMRCLDTNNFWNNKFTTICKTQKFIQLKDLYILK